VLRQSQMLIAVANSLRAKHEPTRAGPHHIDDIFGARAESVRFEGSIARSDNGFVEVVEIARREASTSLVSNGGSIRTYGRHINLATELNDLFGAHASSDVAPRHTET